MNRISNKPLKCRLFPEKTISNKAEMEKPRVRSIFSQVPVEVHIHDDQGKISTATAFFYEREERLYLITNWHVVSGRIFLQINLWTHFVVDRKS